MNRFGADHTLGYAEALPELADFNETADFKLFYSEHAKWDGEYDEDQKYQDQRDQDQGRSEEVEGQRNQDEKWRNDAYEADGGKNAVDNGKGKYLVDEKPTVQYGSEEGEHQTNFDTKKTLLIQSNTGTKHDSKTRKYTSNFSTVSQDRTGGAEEIDKRLLLLIGRMQGDPNIVSTKHGSKLIEDAAKLRVS
jgi:hypothetical protein